jgi:hypothetical protein
MSVGSARVTVGTDYRDRQRSALERLVPALPMLGRDFLDSSPPGAAGGRRLCRRLVDLGIRVYRGGQQRHELPLGER